MIIRNASVLVGDSLRYVRHTDVQISQGRYGRIGSGIKPEPGQTSFDCSGLLMIPGLVNCHTHVGDSVGKDVALDATTHGTVHPVLGAKARILSRTPPQHLESFMRSACLAMLRRGITTFVDFREGGLDGIRLLKRAAAGTIRSVILGRPDQYHASRQVRLNEAFPESKTAMLYRILDECDGIGISGANENSTAQLEFYSRTGKLRAIHAAETTQSMLASRRMTKKSEVLRALHMRPHFLVHMTHANARELKRAAAQSRGIVICPRANAALAGGIPDIEMMRRAGCTVAIGTDNVMINPPDMFREMDYLWKATMGLHRRRLDPAVILQAATVNAGRILDMKIGSIRRGYLADAVFVDKNSIDLAPMHNPHAALVHRASGDAIRAVMINGRIMHGRL